MLKWGLHLLLGILHIGYTHYWVGTKTTSLWSKGIFQVFRHSQTSSNRINLGVKLQTCLVFEWFFISSDIKEIRQISRIQKSNIKKFTHTVSEKNVSNWHYFCQTWFSYDRENWCIWTQKQTSLRDFRTNLKI